MRIRFLIPLVVITLLSGCKAVDGVYMPDCAAFEGSRITLSGGEFIWEKFTDQVIVDDDGNIINQFPDYPRVGTYRVSGQDLELTFTDDDTVTTMQIHERYGRLSLLTADEVAEWQRSGRYEQCVLTRELDR